MSGRFENLGAQLACTGTIYRSQNFRSPLRCVGGLYNFNERFYPILVHQEKYGTVDEAAGCGFRVIGGITKKTVLGTVGVPAVLCLYLRRQVDSGYRARSDLNHWDNVSIATHSSVRFRIQTRAPGL
jgi:hypothetical protein